MTSYHKLSTITYHNWSKVVIDYDRRVAVFPIFVFLLFPFFLFSLFFLFLFLFFFVFLCPLFYMCSSLFLCFFCLYLSISSILNEQMGRSPFSVTTPEEAASMNAVRQLHGRPTPRSMSGASPNSLIFIRGTSRPAYRNVPVQVLRATVEHERNDQDVHGTSEWPLLPLKLAWQQTEAVFVNMEPVNKVRLIKNQKSLYNNKM